MTSPIIPKLHNITYEQTERLGYRITQFVVGKMKYFPLIHLSTLVNNNLISKSAYIEISTLFGQFEVSLYVNIVNILFQAFKHNKSGFSFSISSEKNMSQILSILDKEKLILYPLGDDDIWSLKVEYIPSIDSFMIAETSHGRADYSKTIPFNDAFSPLSNSGQHRL